MAKTSLDRIIPLLLKQEPLNGVLGLLRELIVLQEKLNAIDEQDFYFQKGIANHTKRLESLKRQYAQIVETVNDNTVDYFLDKVIECESKVQKLTSKGYLNTIDQIALTGFKREISKYKNLLHIKGQYGKLGPLDELIG